jgi:hypothetical protein
MDYELLTLIAMMVAVMVVGFKLDFWWWPGRPRRRYQQAFSLGSAGLLLLGAGLVGWDLSHSHGLFQGTIWVDGPIWWQVGVGTALLLTACVWLRRVPLGRDRVKSRSS